MYDGIGKDASKNDNKKAKDYFSGGSAVYRLPIIMIPKKYPSKDRNGNSVRLGYQVIDLSARCSFCGLLLFRQSFVSVADSVHYTDVKGERFSG